MSTPAIIPVSVAEEEDIARQQHRQWDHNDDAAQRRPSRKGKEKESEFEEDSPWSAGGESSLPLNEEGLQDSARPSSYPPLNDEQEETRRIQENLKRMEQAELQRRRAARQSTSLSGGGSAGGPSQSSIVENVTRRASLLWQNRGSGHHANSSSTSRKNGSMGGGLGHHQKLPSTDNLPLAEIASAADDTPTASPTRSETNLSINSVSTITSPQSNGKGVDLNSKRLQEPVDDPFNPPEQHEVEVSSPFSDPPEPTTPGAYQTSALAGPGPEGLRDSSGSAITRTRQPPPPRPLGLPRPKTPPPIDRSDLDEDDGEAKKTRWWHEWLCGCGEGPDRGGSHQAGRTNPFE